MRPKLITRSQAANMLHQKDPSKSESQWHSFLNDNAKPRVKPENKIPYEKTIHHVAMYKTSDIEAFLAKRAAKKAALESSRIAEAKLISGLDSKENQNSFGQSFGYVWKGAHVGLIPDNAERGQPDAVSIQLQINHPLRVSALTTQQAEEFANQILDAVAAAKRYGL
ncbi:hypothetical protein NRA11_17200 [Acinetobacter baumannii]|nr:hypothetical protein [Acinetobacter baumannii]MDC5065223.1 hypothetical protein [Acinetobacter baumannii]